MKLILLTLLLVSVASAAEPLRVFIRAGKKSHAPGAHDYPQFLADWVPMLNERGAKCQGSMDFPTQEQLDQTDVLVLHSQEAGNINIGAERKNFEAFVARGGGVVVIHAGAVSRDPDWFKSIVGGSWNHKRPTKWLEAPMHLYFTDRENPITESMANFAIDDEIYYDMDLLPEARILAGAYTPNPRDTGGKGNKEAQQRAAEAVAKKKGVNIYDIQPQVWTYEKDKYRAFTCIPGHWYKNFSHNTLRTMILRGIAWAGKRTNADELCKPQELGDALRYPEGGPTHPSKAAEKLELHPDFNISLVAAEPLINKPMNLDWDEKGRLWVCETPEYPNGRRELNVELWKDSGSWTKKNDREPIDRISILTDTNGDGIMDKKQVFADKLELATSFVFYKNGVIVCSAPDIWFLEDTNGDEVADKRTKLYTGLGIRDTHAVINNMRWGLDGWIYATHGYSSGDVTALGKPDAKPVTIGSGVCRFKPDGTEIEQYSSKGGNTWGLDITWDGQVFFTQPTSGTVFYHVVLPEYVLAKGKIPGTNSYHGMITGQSTYPLLSWPEQAYVQIDYVGQFTAAAGCAIYEGGAWPEKWKGSYFTTEPTLNIVHHQFVEKDGVTYKTHKEKGREETEFIRSRDLWFRPIEVRVGPDGALYVIDFYNQAVIHNDTRGPIHGPANAAVRPDRDHYYGRIWKVNHKQAKKVENPLAKLDTKPLREGVATDDSELVAILDKHPNAHVKHSLVRLLRQSPAPFCFGMSIKSDAGKIFDQVSVFDPSAKNQSECIQRYCSANDDWTRSALIAAASGYSPAYLIRALEASEPWKLDTFVAAIMPMLEEDLTKSPPAVPKSSDAKDPFGTTPKNIKEWSFKLNDILAACGGAGSAANSLKSIILHGMAQHLNEVPELTPDLTEALKKLLAQPALASAALPLAVKWDKGGALADTIKTQIANLSSLLSKPDAPLPERISAARALVSLGGDFSAVGVQALAAQGTPAELSSAIIEALDQAGNTTPLVTALATLAPALQQPAFDAILKRPESSQALLAAISENKLDPKLLGPGNIARLRTHPNKQVAKRAVAMMDKLNPNAKKKAELIAQFTPIVEQPGDAAKGKLIFTAACSICHKLGDVGTRDVGPALVGMGTHGPAELLIHILDPNREVDASFYAWNITKKNGETLAGVVASENAASVTLRNQVGDFEVKKADIDKRENTKLSLMPEGLEGLGAENIRDILAFIVGESGKDFRVLTLADAFTADSREGIFAGPAGNQGMVRLKKFGSTTVKGVPFAIQDAAKSATGANLIVLKGGPQGAHSQSHPTEVEVPVGVIAQRFHLLSGISGWGWPAHQGPETALRVVAVLEDGSKETVDLLNGVHFADYIRHVDVPGSEFVDGYTQGEQLRFLTIELKQKAKVQKLLLQSPQPNPTVPVVVAITADLSNKGPAPGSTDVSQRTAPAPRGKGKAEPETGPKEGGKGDGPLAPAAAIQWEAGKTKVLIIGGGSSHNFAKFFGETDSATLSAAGYSVHYTEDRDQATAEVGNADVCVISVNRKFFDTPAYRKALFDRINAGKGVIMMHPGTWYGFAGWPEINKEIVGGGSRGHDKLGEFKVNVTRKDHAIMIGVPHSFDVFDELYYMNAEGAPEGTRGIEVLAETSPSQKYKKAHPSVWITDHPKARIVGIALGHDERVHDLPAFKALLSNAVKWVAGK